MPRKRLEYVRVFGDLGTVVEINGQPYRLIRVEPYTNRAGDQIGLCCWQAECAECGAPFETMRRPGAIPDVRRCPSHRKPGLRVASPTEPSPFVDKRGTHDDD